MVDVEAAAWSREVFGEVGPYVREKSPQVLLATHNRYSAHQVALGLETHEPYGLMWLGLPKAMVDAFRGLSGIQTYRPPWGRYRLPVINGAPLIPWRYAKDSTTDVDKVPFGRPVSTPRRAMFEQLDLQAELPLGKTGLGDDIIATLSVEERHEFDAYGRDIKQLVTDTGLSAVLAYASTPDGVLRCYLGYAELGDEDMLAWHFREEIKLSTIARVHLTSVAGTTRRPAFDAGEPAVPALRPRSPLENTPTGAGEPHTTAEKTVDDD